MHKAYQISWFLLTIVFTFGLTAILGSILYLTTKALNGSVGTIGQSMKRFPRFTVQDVR